MTDGAGLVHATALVVGEAGLLIEGASGSGKSQLALALIAAAATAGRFGRLVGDDRVSLAAMHGRLVARAHPAIAGLIERRGLGIVPEPFEPACVLTLVVVLAARRAAEPERLPATPPTRTLHGVAIPCLTLRRSDPPVENARRVLLALQGLSPASTDPF